MNDCEHTHTAEVSTAVANTAQQKRPWATPSLTLEDAKIATKASKISNPMEFVQGASMEGMGS